MYKTMKRPICLLLIIALVFSNVPGLLSFNIAEATGDIFTLQSYFDEVSVTPVSTGFNVSFSLDEDEILALTVGSREFRVELPAGFAPESVTPETLVFEGEHFAGVNIKDDEVFVIFLDTYFNIESIVTNDIKEISGSFSIAGKSAPANKEIPVEITGVTIKHNDVIVAPGADIVVIENNAIEMNFQWDVDIDQWRSINGETAPLLVNDGDFAILELWRPASMPINMGQINNVPVMNEDVRIGTLTLGYNDVDGLAKIVFNDGLQGEMNIGGQINIFASLEIRKVMEMIDEEVEFNEEFSFTFVLPENTEISAIAKRFVRNTGNLNAIGSLEWQIDVNTRLFSLQGPQVVIDTPAAAGGELAGHSIDAGSIKVFALDVNFHTGVITQGAQLTSGFNVEIISGSAHITIDDMDRKAYRIVLATIPADPYGFTDRGMTFRNRAVLGEDGPASEAQFTRTWIVSDAPVIGKSGIFTPANTTASPPVSAFITWTVLANRYGHELADGDLVITDKLGAGQALRAGSVQVFRKLYAPAPGSSDLYAGRTAFTDYSIDTSNGGFTLTVPAAQLKDNDGNYYTFEIVFIADVTADRAEYENDAEFSQKDGFSIEINARVARIGTSGVGPATITKSSPSVDTTAQTISWVVLVSSMGQRLSGTASNPLAIRDNFSYGTTVGSSAGGTMLLRENSLLVEVNRNGEWETVPADQYELRRRSTNTALTAFTDTTGFEVVFTDVSFVLEPHQQIRLTFDTDYTLPADGSQFRPYDANGNLPARSPRYSNSATLRAIRNNTGSRTDTTSNTVDRNISMPAVNAFAVALSKSGSWMIDEEKSEWHFEWRITVNDSNQDIGNREFVIRDWWDANRMVLADGFDKDSLTLMVREKGSSVWAEASADLREEILVDLVLTNSGDMAGREFFVTLANVGDRAVRISYNAERHANALNITSFVNRAQIGTLPQVAPTVSVPQLDAVEKQTSWRITNDGITWTLDINNRTGRVVHDAVVVDRIGAGHMLVKDSIVVRRGNASGALLKYGDDYTVDITEDGLTQVMTIKFIHPINGRHTIIYATEIDPDTIGNTLQNGQHVLRNGFTFSGTGFVSRTREATVRNLWVIASASGSGRRAVVYVEKICEDDSSVKLSGAEFELYRLNPDSGEYERYMSDEDFVTDADGRTWLGTTVNNNRVGLRAGHYYLKEVTAPGGYRIIGEGITYFVIHSVDTQGRALNQTGGLLADIVIRNTLVNYTELTVTKEWIGENPDGHPDSIEVQLYQDGEAHDTATLDNNNGWTHTWEELDDYYEWTVSEPDVPLGYTAEVTGEDTDWTIINTFAPGSLRLIKEVAGGEAATDLDFEFTVTFDKPVIYNGAEFESGTILLSHGKYALFTGIEIGTGYTIVEKNIPADWSSDKVDDEVKGTVDKDELEVKVTFVNTYAPGSLTLTKEVDGRGADRNKLFTFTVTFDKPVVYNDEVIEANTEITVILKHGEYALFTEIQIGTRYTIEEDDYSDDSYASNKPENTESELILCDERVEVKFVNTYAPGTFKLTKQVVGEGADEEKDFTFTVTFSRQVMMRIENTEVPFTSGTITLKHGEYAEFTGIQGGTTYRIVENDYSAEGYTSNYADNTTRGIIRSSNAATAVIFVNTYAPASLTLTKEVDGEDADTDKEFEFNVTFTGAFVYDGTSYKAGDSVKVELSHGKTAVFTGLQIGTGYTIVETVPAGWHSDKVNDEVKGTVEAGEENEIEVKVTFVNTYAPGNLRLTKQVTGAGANLAKEFEFTVEFSEAVTFGEDNEFISGTITLSHGEAAEFTRIALGTTYTITEADYTAERYFSYVDGSSASSVTGETADEDIVITFENRFIPPAPNPGPGPGPDEGDNGGGDDDDEDDNGGGGGGGSDTPPPATVTPTIIMEQINLEEFEEVAIPLTDGYVAIQIPTEEGEDDIYEIFDDEGTPLGIVIIPEGEDIEELFDIDDMIPLADFITLMEEAVEDEIVIIELAEEVIIEEIPTIATTPETGVVAPKTDDTVIILMLFAMLGAAVIIFKRKRTV